MTHVAPKSDNADNSFPRTQLPEFMCPKSAQSSRSTSPRKRQASTSWEAPHPRVKPQLQRVSCCPSAVRTASAAEELSDKENAVEAAHYLLRAIEASTCAGAHIYRGSDPEWHGVLGSTRVISLLSILDEKVPGPGDLSRCPDCRLLDLRTEYKLGVTIGNIYRRNGAPTEHMEPYETVLQQDIFGDIDDGFMEPYDKV